MFICHTWSPRPHLSPGKKCISTWMNSKRTEGEDHRKTELSECGLCPYFFFKQRKNKWSGSYRDANSWRTAVWEGSESTPSDREHWCFCAFPSQCCQTMPAGKPPPTQPLCCCVSHSALVTGAKSPSVVMATQGWIWSLWFEPNRARGSLHRLNAAWFPVLALVSWRTVCCHSLTPIMGNPMAMSNAWPWEKYDSAIYHSTLAWWCSSHYVIFKF